MNRSGGEGVLVVGADGFIGSALVRHLTAAGESVEVATGKDPITPGGPRWGAALGARTLVWAASTINPAIAEAHPERVEADRRLVVDFVDAMARDGAVGRFVVLSSGGTVYGDLPSPHRETSETAPKGAYGAAKLRIEREVQARYERTTVLRLANVYGPGQPRAHGQGVMGHWLRDVRDGRPVQVIGSLKASRDYVCIGDVLDLLQSVHEAAHPLAPIINGGSGRATSLGELRDVVREVVAPREMRIKHSEGRAFDVSSTWLDVSLAERELGWRARTSLKQGVGAMWRWVQEEEHHEGA